MLVFFFSFHKSHKANCVGLEGNLNTWLTARAGPNSEGRERNVCVRVLWRAESHWLGSRLGYVTNTLMSKMQQHPRGNMD